MAENQDMEEAKKLFEQAVTLKPDYAYAYYALALAYEKEKNFEKALQNYESFLQYTNDKNMKTNIQYKINYLKSRVFE